MLKKLTFLLAALLFTSLSAFHTQACTMTGNGKSITVESGVAHNFAGTPLFYLSSSKDGQNEVHDSRTRSILASIDSSHSSLSEPKDNGIELVLILNKVYGRRTRTLVATDVVAADRISNRCSIPEALLAGYAIALGN